MIDRDIEMRLKNEIESATPDIFSSVLESCEREERVVLRMEKKSRKKYWIAAVAALCVVFAGAIGYNQTFAVQSIVGLDVNPSIEMKVSKSERVVAVDAINDDGKNILDGMDLDGVDIDVAVNALIGSMFKNGYIDEAHNSILLSVENSDKATQEAMQSRLTADIEEMLAGYAFDGAVISQSIEKNKEIEALAAKYGISVGKATMINRIVAEDPNKNFEDLVDATVNELNLIASSNGTQGINTSGKVSTSGYIGESAAKQAALKRAGVREANASFREIHIDYDYGKVVYDVEFISNGYEYEFEIDALSGTVVEYDKEPVDDGDWAPTNSNADRSAGTGSSSKNRSGSSSAGTGSSSKASVGADGLISRDAAIAAALSHAGVSKSAAARLEAEYDREDNDYEIDFVSNGYEYEYDIDAYTGKVLKYSKEYDD